VIIFDFVKHDIVTVVRRLMDSDVSCTLKWYIGVTFSNSTVVGYWNLIISGVTIWEAMAAVASGRPSKGGAAC